MGKASSWSDEDQTDKEHRVRFQAQALACESASKQIFPELHSSYDFLPLSGFGSEVIWLGRSLRKGRRRLRPLFHSPLCCRVPSKACGIKISLFLCALELPRLDDGGIWFGEHHQRVYLLRCWTNVGYRHKSGENPQSLPVEWKNRSSKDPCNLNAELRSCYNERGKSHDSELHLLLSLGSVLIRDCSTPMALGSGHRKLLNCGQRFLDSFQSNVRWKLALRDVRNE